MTSDLFNRIAEELPKLQGWCEIDKAIDLAASVVALRPKVVVEIGVFGGRSLIPMALACQALHHGGIIYGIDPWSPAAATEGYEGKNKEWWANLDYEAVYLGFIRALQQLGLDANCVHILRMKSDDAPVPAVIDLLHLDSQHTEQVLREIDRFGSKVRVGGLIVLDDLDWANDGICHVGLAVGKLLSSGFIELYRTKTATGHWGVFQRIVVSTL